MASQILNASGVSSSQTKSDYKPVKRGGGGPLKTLLWQGPTLLNPHFAVGTKDSIGSRVFYEPLAVWDPDADPKALVPGIFGIEIAGGAHQFKTGWHRPLPIRGVRPWRSFEG
jgi:hypothetical protein